MVGDLAGEGRQLAAPHPRLVFETWRGCGRNAVANVKQIPTPGKNPSAWQMLIQVNLSRILEFLSVSVLGIVRSRKDAASAACRGSPARSGNLAVPVVDHLPTRDLIRCCPRTRAPWAWDWRCMSSAATRRQQHAPPYPRRRVGAAAGELAEDISPLSASRTMRPVPEPRRACLSVGETDARIPLVPLDL